MKKEEESYDHFWSQFWSIFVTLSCSPLPRICQTVASMLLESFWRLAPFEPMHARAQVYVVLVYVLCSVGTNSSKCDVRSNA